MHILRSAVLLLLAGIAHAGSSWQPLRQADGLVYYQGEAVVHGRYAVNQDVKLTGGCALAFYVDSASTRRLPRGHDVPGTVWFCFDTPARARDMLRIPSTTSTSCGYRAEATIRITNYVAGSRAQAAYERYDRARLAQVLFTSPPEAIACLGL